MILRLVMTLMIVLNCYLKRAKNIKGHLITAKVVIEVLKNHLSCEDSIIILKYIYINMLSYSLLS